MKKILVPLDFSDTASWGFYYAYELAKSLNAELTALHLYWPYNGRTVEDPVDLISNINMEIEKEALFHLKGATTPPIYTNKAVNVHHIAASGVDQSIADIAEQEAVDMIVMSSHGEGQSFRKIWGTNTNDTIRKADCPVLVVPPGTTFSPIQQIAYGTDFHIQEDATSLSKLSHFAAQNEANIHCIHVYCSHPQYRNKANQSNELKAQLKAPNISYNSRSAQTIEGGLATFCRINNIDILAVSPQDKTFWDKVFGKKSITKSLLEQTKIPLLSFPS
jgi:nucleotide-binding universal stress UspA family protein